MEEHSLFYTELSERRIVGESLKSHESAHLHGCQELQSTDTFKVLSFFEPQHRELLPLFITMNRFRSKKKPARDAQASRRLSTESDVPALPTFSSKTFRRNKKAQPEPKPEVDIAAALPPSDDFRTSLLMPNLSARFSMLREQDDPNSKIGKANDDSVLFPKRASRLDLFGHNNLTDIAEVDSLRDSIRPPFASYMRTGSVGSGVTDGYGTDDDTSHSGSVMSRSRPGEGNTLFGGRQKIYKIPVGGSASSKNLSANEGGESAPAKGMGGKLLYGDDVATSAFQKLRDQARQEREREEQARQNARSSKEHDRSRSPPPANYNRNRETGSSTTSGPSQPRTSTAATSIASQRSIYERNGNGSSHTNLPSTQGSIHSHGPDRPYPKSRRLYGQGLEQQMHEQQSSAMHRLESLHRQRTVSGQSRNVQQSRSATNLHDRFQRSGPLYASSGFRAGSPPPSATPTRMAEFDLGLTEGNRAGSPSQNEYAYGRSPPLSPLMSPSPDATLVSALEPNDLGKATALGAFNKPKQQYNEQQYLQRQLQLQQGRETPPLARPFSPQAQSIDEQISGRTRENSLSSMQSRTGSFKHQPERQGNDHVLSMVPESSSPRREGRKINEESHPAMNGSFLAGMSGSELGSPTESDMETETHAIKPDEPGSQSLSSVADRTRASQEPFQFNITSDHDQDTNSELALPDEPSRDDRSVTTVTQAQHSSTADQIRPTYLGADSPTLGPTNGLSGLVHTHLRNHSGQSSIYPEQSPGLIEKFPHDLQNNHYPGELQTQSGRSETCFRDSTWTQNNVAGEQMKREPLQLRSDNALPPLSNRVQIAADEINAPQSQDSSKSPQALGPDKAQRVLGDEAPRRSQESSDQPSWQEQLKAHHARAGSTETEKEREGLAMELAERRRMVQNKLESFVGPDSRSGSPMSVTRSRDDSPAKPGIPFGVLKSKTSRGSLIGKDKPSKAMKMLGISANSSLTNLSSHPSQESFFKREDDQSNRYARGHSQTRREPPGRQPQDNFRPQRPREPSNERIGLNPHRRPSPPSARRVGPGRAGSDASERPAEAWNGQQRSFAARVAAERDRINGYQPNTFQPRDRAGMPRSTEELNASMAGHPSPAERSQSAMSGRMRSNGMGNTPGYFDSRGPLPDQKNNSPLGGASHRGPPTSPYSASSNSSSHGASPVDSYTTPTMITSQESYTTRRGPNIRKQSVNKHDISEPMFLSSTSSVGTIDLPPGASLSNGMEPPSSRPPIPPQNPRRRRTNNLLQALGRLEKPDEAPPPPMHPENPYEERSTFSADESESKASKMRQRLRKTSSEGGNLAAKARQHAMMEPSPAVPNFSPTSHVPSPGTMQTQAFHNPNHPSAAPYPPPQMHFGGGDVPASAVMF